MPNLQSPPPVNAPSTPDRSELENRRACAEVAPEMVGATIEATMSAAANGRAALAMTRWRTASVRAVKALFACIPGDRNFRKILN